MKFFDVIKSIAIWAASAVEDQRGSVSSKRIGFYFSFWLLKVLITAPNANTELVWPIIAIIATLAGMTLPEWFSKLKDNKSVTGG